MNLYSKRRLLMEQLRTKKCVYCGYYEGYYTRKLHRYERTNKGYCRKHDKIVLNGETCERWQNNASRRALCRRAVSRELYEMMMDLSAIRQIFQDTEWEKKQADESNEML